MPTVIAKTDENTLSALTIEENCPLENDTSAPDDYELILYWSGDFIVE